MLKRSRILSQTSRAAWLLGASAVAMASSARASAVSAVADSDDQVNLSVRQAIPSAAPASTSGVVPLHGAQFWASKTSLATVYGASEAALGSTFTLNDLSGYEDIPASDVLGTSSGEMKMYEEVATQGAPLSKKASSSAELTTSELNPATIAFSSVGKNFAVPAALTNVYTSPLNFNLNLSSTPEPGAAGLIVFLAGVGGLSLRRRKPITARA